MLSLDHYVGRTVQDVSADEDGWEITLDGNVIIRNLDPNQPIDSEIKGTSFLSVDFSGDDPDMSFGQSLESGPVIQSHVSVTTGAYTISTPEGEQVQPERDAVNEDTLPPDPSDERVAEGPTGPEEAPMAAEAPQKRSKTAKAKK